MLNMAVAPSVDVGIDGSRCFKSSHVLNTEFQNVRGNQLKSFKRMTFQNCTGTQIFVSKWSKHIYGI